MIFLNICFGGDNPRMGGDMSPPSPPGFTPEFMLFIAEKYFIQIIFLILSLSELVKNARACLASFKHNSPETKHVVRSGNIWIRNKRGSQFARVLPFTVADNLLLGMGNEDRRMKDWIYLGLFLTVV